jgi:hypothetical protein
MKNILLILIASAMLFSACDLDKNSPSLVSPDLNLRFVNGEYVPSDADAQLTALQVYYHLYILFPPDTIPTSYNDSSGVAFAVFKYKEIQSISVGTTMFNGDTLPYLNYYGYSSNFNTGSNTDIFKFGANWKFGGNEKFNFPGGTIDNSSNIPRLTLDTVLSRYRKADGINIKIKTTDMNCNRLVVAIKKGDSVLFSKELEPFSTEINLSPSELSVLPSNDYYSLIVKAKNYLAIVNNNKKYYYLNEINSVHDFVLD